MKLHLTIAIILIMMACTSQNLLASGPVIFINPGVKFGYSFGEKGGFTYGVQLSITSTFSSSFSPFWGGIVFNAYKCNGRKSVHFGAQASYWGFGMEAGPTYLYENGSSHSGYSIIPFGGLIIIPYYNYTKFETDSLTSHEVGSYIKIPGNVFGQKISLVH
jgi:hypothetical protein